MSAGYRIVLSNPVDQGKSQLRIAVAHTRQPVTMTPVVHLTPELQPMIGGIADYTAILGRAMTKRGIPQHLSRGRPCRTGAPAGHSGTFPASPRAQFHYSQRSFARFARPRGGNGTPPLLRLRLCATGGTFLAGGGLEHWKKLRAHHRLIVMFHETWANGLPWQSSFWLSPLQNWCVARVARLADAVVTNTSYYRARLEFLLRPGTSIQVQPIFSNIGEPDAVPAFAEREPVCVLFGRGTTRRRTNERFRRYFDELRMLGIERLIEIGVEPEITARLEWPFPVASLGPRKTSEISAIMARVKYGLIDCPVHVAGKSGVLAALAAHGTVPIHPEGRGNF